MRILFVADRLSARGGADVHLLGVLGELGRRHVVELAVGRIDGTASVRHGVTVVDGLADRGGAEVAIEPVVGRFGPDVVHLHNVVNPRVLEWGAAHGAVITVQDHRFFCPGRGKLTADGTVCTAAMDHGTCAGCFADDAYFAEVLELTQRRLRALRGLEVVVLSRYMQRELELVGVEPTRIHVIPPFVHGLDLDARAGGPPCALFVGRLVAAKGAVDAIEAWRRSGVTLPLLLAGTGSERRVLERHRGVEVLGWVPHDELAPLYRRAAVVIMPSRWQEPFGIVGLEALTMGTPVAAWRCGGVEEWHPGPGLVPWGDVDALAEAVAELPGTSVARPQRFAAPVLMERLETLYARLASR